MYIYIRTCRPLKKEASSQVLQEFWGRCLFCLKKKTMNLKVGEQHGGPNHLRARFLDQIWGKRFFPKDMPGSSVTKRGSKHWKAGPGWILGKVVENIRIQGVFIIYIYMYNIIRMYIYTHIYLSFDYFPFEEE